MNERIQELAAKAGWGPTSDPYIRQALDVNMFAELIVKECATMADFADKNPGEYVLKHFGVKE